MANNPVSAYNALTNSNYAADDLLLVVDTDAEETKNSTLEELFKNLRVGLMAPGTDGVHVVAIPNGTPPTSRPADGVQMWAGDFGAGDSRLYILSEATAGAIIIGNGAIIREAPSSGAGNNLTLGGSAAANGNSNGGNTIVQLAAKAGSGTDGTFDIRAATSSPGAPYQRWIDSGGTNGYSVTLNGTAGTQALLWNKLTAASADAGYTFAFNGTAMVRIDAISAFYYLGTSSFSFVNREGQAALIFGGAMAVNQTVGTVSVLGTSAWSLATSNKVGGTLLLRAGGGGADTGQTAAHGGDAKLLGGAAAATRASSNGGQVYVCGGALGTDGVTPGIAGDVWLNHDSSAARGRLRVCAGVTTGVSSLGTVIGKWAIYDAAGTIIGYLPIYDDIT